MPEQHFFDAIYGMLTLIGLNPADFTPNLEHESGEGRVVLGIQSSRVALATDGDDWEPFEDDGWFVAYISQQDLAAAARVFEHSSTLFVEHARRIEQERAVKHRSNPEDLLWEEIVRSNLPEPNRNIVIRRDDGSELTTPDFAWSDYSIAFYVDGYYWHVGKDKSVREQIASLPEGERERALLEADRTRQERDLENRSELQARGWRVLACSDRDVMSDEGRRRQVDLIRRTMRLVSSEQETVQQIKSKSDGGASVEGILSFLDEIKEAREATETGTH
jgi:G:T-mismatch repair DNA endonuclease (very short patch repair protein)